MAIKWCEKCKGQGGGKFCSNCGERLSERPSMCDCGYDNIWPHEKFCQECGRPTPFNKKASVGAA